MREFIWLDGFNFFHAWHDTRDSFREAQRGTGDIITAQRVGLSLLAQTLGRRCSRVTVYMDGGLERSAGSLLGLRVRYSGPGKKADDLMLEAARGLTSKAKRITAVTNDRSLGDRLKYTGLRVSQQGDFITYLTKAASSGKRGEAAAPVHKQKVPGKIEVDFWLKIFGDDTVEG